MTVPQEQLIEHIRFDVDYHCLSPRETAATQGTINRELHRRLKEAENKEQPIYPVGMRLRIYNTLGLKLDNQNHAIFDEAIEVFKTRLAVFDERSTQDYSGTGIVIID